MPSKKKTRTEIQATVSTASMAEPKKTRVIRAASASVRKETSNNGRGTLAAKQSTRAIPTRRTSKPRSRVPKAVHAPAAETSPANPERDEISLLAYSYWEARGCQGGSPEEDWYRAEQEIQRRKNAGSSPE